MRVDEIISKLGTKPISREALARCADTLGKTELADCIRQDSSFDVVLVSGPNTDNMVVFLVKHAGEFPMYGTYCGTAVRKAMQKLTYARGHQLSGYSSIIEINQ